MRLFDDKGIASSVDIDVVECIKNDVQNRTTHFCTGDQWFHDGTTINQLVQLYELYGFAKIDKNRLVNINKAERFENGKLWVNGHEYTVSRRNISNIQRLFNQKLTDSIRER
jgi:DNA-binding LytR/AlgR family response regulator